MKKNTLKGFLFISSVAVLVASCDVIKDAKYTVNPNPLEMHGDTVKISATIEFPPKGIHKKAKAEVTPMLGNTPLKQITVLGEKATGSGNTVMYKPGGTFTYNDMVIYKPEMENADLTITGKVYKGSSEKETIPVTVIGVGTKITPLLVKKDFKVILASDNFQRVTEKTFKSQINYEKGKSVVRPGELKDRDIFEFENWLKAAESNPKISIKTINIIGYASPEGEVGANESLSSDRAAAAKVVAMNLAQKSKNTKAQTEIYNLSGRGEDYDGFKAEMEKSMMVQDEKQLVIRVLEMYKDPVQRETEMRNMAKTFVYLDKNVFPLLRRAEIQVVYDQTGYTDEELMAISKTNPENLTVEELLFTATLTEDLAEKARLYTEVTTNYPLDIRGHNNLGAVLYMQNNMTEAGYKFDAANSLEDNTISKNNLGAIQAMQGNKKRAKELFAQASGAGPEVNYNLGYYNILEGNYPKAITNLGTENTFNKALAQLLNGSPDVAVKTIDGSADKESGMGYYLKAVAAARMDRVNEVASNLKSAFSKDSSLKAKAAKDREFWKFKDNPTYADLVK